MIFKVLSIEEWSAGEAQYSLLDEEEFLELRSLSDGSSYENFLHVYGRLAELILMKYQAHCVQSQLLSKFLGSERRPSTFIIGIGGSVSVGKSTAARFLCKFLQRLVGEKHTVDLFTTDGFLFPNDTLRSNGLMLRKGFPESYNRTKLLSTFRRIRQGERSVQIPTYSHLRYDVCGTELEFVVPDILLVEGLHVCNLREIANIHPSDPEYGDATAAILDFAVFLDADEVDIFHWYVARFSKLRETAFENSESYFYKYSKMPLTEALAEARDIWLQINLLNLRENISPSKGAADVILRKGGNHEVAEILLRLI